MTIRTINIRRHDVSEKGQFDEITFRENDVAPDESNAKLQLTRVYNTDSRRLGEHYAARLLLYAARVFFSIFTLNI